MSPSPGVRPDLATRLRQSQRALKGRLAKPETALALMRAAHDILDPAKIGELVVDRAVEWLKASSCAVLTTDLDGQVVPIGWTRLEPGAHHGRDRRRAAGCWRADVISPARICGTIRARPGRRGATMAVPLRSSRPQYRRSGAARPNGGGSGAQARQRVERVDERRARRAGAGARLRAHAATSGGAVSDR